MIPQFKEHQGLVHRQAMFGLKWAHKVGLKTCEYDDMFQEASIAFMKAAEGYKEDSGFKFSAYYTKVSFSQFRKVIGRLTGVKSINAGQRDAIEARKEENRDRREAGEDQLPQISYIIPMVSFDAMAGGDGQSFEETIASDALTPEQLLDAKQTLAAATAKLSPLAQLVVQWLREPPPELSRELQSQMAHADYANEKKQRVIGYRNGLTIDSVSKFIGLLGRVDADDVDAVKVELDQFVKEVEEA